MKVVFVGGGSFRTLPIIRSAMQYRQVFDKGEIRLLDPSVARAEAVGRAIVQTPEYAGIDCKVSWGSDPDRALDGADVVSVSFAVGSPVTMQRSMQASMRHGFHGSDQLSLTGGFLGLTAGPAILDYAQRMERLCPRAWLVDFANPVAVYSGMVNNHTRIRALGICGGFTNYRWDLTRLMGRDAYSEEFDVDAAGINHLSFILRGTWRGQDLYKVLGRRLRQGYEPPRIDHPNPAMRRHIRFGLQRLAEMYRRFGCMIYSTEGDGMIHLFFEEMFARGRREPRPKTLADMRKWARGHRQARVEADRRFREEVDKPHDAAFWKAAPKQNPAFARSDRDVTVLVLKALGGVSREKLVASRTNQGAVVGFKDRTVLEYSMFLDRKGVTPVPNLEVPDCFHGLISSLATHQTLLGDAVAARDPRILADALFAYPLYQNSRQAKALWRDLLRIHAAEIPAEFQKAVDYF